MQARQPGPFKHSGTESDPSEKSNGTFYLSFENENSTGVNEPFADPDCIAVDKEILALSREINQLAKIQADKLLYVLNASINNTVSKLPADIRAMPAGKFFARCDADSAFKSKYNLTFETFDEFNLLGRNHTQALSAVA